MKLLFSALIAIALMGLSSCGLPATYREINTMSRQLYSDIREGHDLAANPNLSPDLRTPAAIAALQQVRQLMPTSPPTSVDNSGFHISTNNGSSRADITHTYHYADRTLVAETVLLRPPGATAWQIAGFHVRNQTGGGSSSTGTVPAASPPAPAADGNSAPPQADTAPAAGDASGNEAGGAPAPTGGDK